MNAQLKEEIKTGIAFAICGFIIFGGMIMEALKHQ